jgi:periodic tryptophan protein 1
LEIALAFDFQQLFLSDFSQKMSESKGKQKKKFTISALCWVPKGACRPDPLEYDLSKDEMEALVKQQAELSMNDEENGNSEESTTDPKSEMDTADDSKSSKSSAKSKSNKSNKNSSSTGERTDSKDTKDEGDEIDKEFNLADYDEEDEEATATIFLGGKNLTVFGSNSEDPYITMPDAQGDSSDEDDEDAVKIRDTDSILLVGSNDQDGSAKLETYVFDESSSRHYVHHDFVLPAMSLAIAWLGCDPRGAHDDNKGKGSFCAIGTMEPGIEIWNLDVLNPLEPVVTLGGRDASRSLKALQQQKQQTSEKSADSEMDTKSDASNGEKSSKKKKKKGKTKQPTMEELLTEEKGPLKPESHTDAVLSLAVDPEHGERLASGSADKSIKLWDVTTQQPVAEWKHHTAPVQSLDWSCHGLLSGSFDQSVALIDVRQPQPTARFKVPGEVAGLTWCPMKDRAVFLAVPDTGPLVAYDCKNTKQPLFTLKAHESKMTTIQCCQAIPNVFVTAADDGIVKVWELVPNKGASLVCARNFKKDIGAVLTMQFDVSSPFVLACGGMGGKDFVIWDIMEDKDIQRKFANFDKRPASKPVAKSKQKSKQDD